MSFVGGLGMAMMFGARNNQASAGDGSWLLAGLGNVRAWAALPRGVEPVRVGLLADVWSVRLLAQWTHEKTLLFAG
jgi:hypothetical protein